MQVPHEFTHPVERMVGIGVEDAHGRGAKVEQMHGEPHRAAELVDQLRGTRRDRRRDHSVDERREAGADREAAQVGCPHQELVGDKTVEQPIRARRG
ncbi:Uncharacterised protein [Mycobacteroides abscessus subsp. abscessus]|nr:Uncharacterised protein [Mycobacteroides abscessus subsp. abscessus]